MRIAVISKADAKGGGASRVAGDIVSGLNKHGEHADHITAWNTNEIRAYGPGLLGRGTGFLHSVSRKTGFSEIIPWELPYLSHLLKRGNYDLIHFHDTSSSISPITIRHLTKNTKVVWTLHDCSPFTGGCIYPQMHNCKKYKDGEDCRSCPGHGEWPLDGRLDTAKIGLKERKKLMSSGLITYIAPSNWMAELAFTSPSMAVKPHVISNSIELDIFKPREDKVQIRQKLGLPTDRPILLTSAGNVQDVRKGLAQALQVAAKLKSDPILVLVGNPHPSVGGSENPDRVFTGYVGKREHLAEWYAAADGFLYCSAADNQPLSVMESLASGLPVFGWEVGGVTEMVNPKNLVPWGRIDALAGRIDAVLGNKDEQMKLSAEARSFAKQHFSIHDAVKNHIDLYKNIIGNKNEDF